MAARMTALWNAFHNCSTVFTFVVCSLLTLTAVGGGLVARAALVPPEPFRSDVACPAVGEVQDLIADLNGAVIRRTIHIQDSIPVVFDVPLDRNLSVSLTGGVPVNRPTTFTLPGAGGEINGSVNLTLPKGQKLPIHMNLTVPVSQTVPVVMDVPVEIPLRETDLGPIIDRLDKMAGPYLTLASDALACAP